MSAAIWALAAAAFAMITTEFNIVGLVPLIALDLNIPVSNSIGVSLDFRPESRVERRSIARSNTRS